MTKTATITAQLDAETMALVTQAAEARGQTADAFAAEAIRRVAESEADFRAFVQVGIDAADRGDLVPHEEVMAKLEAMRAKYAAQCPE